MGSDTDSDAWVADDTSRARSSIRRGVLALKTGPPEYRVDSVPPRRRFFARWVSRRAEGLDSPTTRVMRRLCGDVSMVLTLVEDPPTPVGDERLVAAGKRRRRARGGGARGPSMLGGDGWSSTTTDETRERCGGASVLARLSWSVVMEGYRD